MYTLTADPDRKLITIRIIGMIEPAQVAQLYRDEYAAIHAMGCRLGEHLALVDLTECSLQLQDVAAAFEKQIQSAGKARKLAMFTGASVSKMQARRVMKRDDAALFVTREEAERWLFDDPSSLAA